MAKECPNCQMKPCMGGGGPGSCEDGKSKTGGERGKKAPDPKDTPEHRHDYRMTRETVDVVRDGRKTFSVRTQVFTCHNRQGKCTAPTHIDVKRVRLS